MTGFNGQPLWPQSYPSGHPVDMRINRERWLSQREQHHNRSGLGPDPFEIHEPPVDLRIRKFLQESQVQAAAFFSDCPQDRLNARALLVGEPCYPNRLESPILPPHPALPPRLETYP